MSELKKRKLEEESEDKKDEFKKLKVDDTTSIKNYSVNKNIMAEVVSDLPLSSGGGGGMASSSTSTRGSSKQDEIMPDFTKYDKQFLQSILMQLKKSEVVRERIEEIVKDDIPGSPTNNKLRIDENEIQNATAQQYNEIKSNQNGENIDNTMKLLQSGKSANGNLVDKVAFLDKAKMVPIRLSYNERKYLRLVESATAVSSYTDKVDVIIADEKNFKALARKKGVQMRQMCAMLSGMLVAEDYAEGQDMIKSRDFVKHADFFHKVFEIGRRYKILNPERMRGAYGKMLYVLQDSTRPEIQELLGFNCVTPVRTVHDILSSHQNGLDLLEDPLLQTATMEIISEGKTKYQVQHEIREKNDAIKALSRKYAVVARAKPNMYRRYRGLMSNSDDNEAIVAGATLTEDVIEQCIYSLGDHNTYLRFNREPCDQLIQFLVKYFKPDSYESPELSLAIEEGKSGSRLSHSHERQYRFVLQSLLLWREVLAHMFQLWHFAEEDLLDSESPYVLTNTGQGFQRVQPCPRVKAAMIRILEAVQKEVGVWIGSSQIHLGDHNVPNALMFIDKYAQIPRILGPVVLCLSKISELYQTGPVNSKFIDSCYGGVENLRKLILTDFFRHAFDGSGGDNFFDAGSCVDGRLTSAWNWCSSIEGKAYFPIFLLTGFSGFDGKEGWN